MARAYRRMKSRPILTGIEDVDRLLKEVGGVIANRAARSGLAKGARLASRRMKKAAPRSIRTGRVQPSVKKSLGASTKMVRRGQLRGVTRARAGAAVGKKMDETILSSANYKQRWRLYRKRGVGMGARNIHWFVLGTGERRQKTTGRRTGRMPSSRFLKPAFAASETEVRSLVRQGTLDQLEREIAKYSARARSRVLSGRM